MLNSNQIERFYNYNKQSPKINFDPFLSLGHFGGQKQLFLGL